VLSIPFHEKETRKGPGRMKLSGPFCVLQEKEFVPETVTQPLSPGGFLLSDSERKTREAG
jgi:hypothetical protein